MPACAKALNFFVSTEVGFISAVISILSAILNRLAAQSMMSAVIWGGINEGVPPPKKRLFNSMFL